jgi:tRNA(Ile)-lysidine synthase
MIQDLPSFFKDPHSLGHIPKEEPLLLALSGGADSSALLDLLCRLRKKRGFALFAAHVNHSIRTEEYNNEALRDESFCKELCDSSGVKLFTAHIDVPALAKQQGQSIETVAREERYKFFAEIMKEHGIKALITAHNADDNLETQIFNLCRGCGIEGICGIPETRSFEAAGGIIIRPILSASKQEILKFCADNNVKYVTDSTNLEIDCTRNRIRHNILPELRALFTSPEKAGLRLSQAAREDSEFITAQAEEFLNDGNEGIKVSKLTALPPSVAKRVLRAAFGEYCGGKLETVHVEDLLNYANLAKDGKISLPNKTDAVFSGDILSFSEATRHESASIEYSMPITDGITFIEGHPFAIYTSKDGQFPQSVTDGENDYTLYTYAYLKNVANTTLFASSRQEGDLILDGGMHKKIKKLMCDKKLPAAIRPSLPLIRAGEDVLYVPCCAVADSAKTKKSDADIIIAIYKR